MTKQKRAQGPNVSKIKFTYVAEGLDAMLALPKLSVAGLKKAFKEYSADYEDCDDWKAYMAENHPVRSRGYAASPPKVGEKRGAKVGAPKGKESGGEFLRVPCSGLLPRGFEAEISYQKKGIFIAYAEPQA